MSGIDRTSSGRHQNASLRHEDHDLELLTPDQLCSLLHVRKSWIYDQVEAGRLPHLRLGNQLRFRRADLAEYLRRTAG
jgi:excisionase family DNA binding protein